MGEDPVVASRPVRPGSNPTFSAGLLSAPARRAAFQGAALAAILAATIVLASSRGDVDRMAYGDGLIYRYVAAHLSTPPELVHPVVRERGTSLRYGRIGFPALIWLTSAGQPSAMPYAHPVVVVVSAGAAGAAAALLFPALGPLAALLPFIAPGFPLSVAGGYAEVLAVALALWAVWFAVRQRWGWSAAFLAGAMLTRENAAAVLLALFVAALVRRQTKGALVLLWSVVPLALWYGFVAGRFGHIPVLDPYLRVATDTVGVPGVAFVRSLVDAATVGAALMAVAHLAAGLAGASLARRSVLGVVAAAATLQVLASGPFAWQFLGEAVRTGIFVQTFAILAVVERLRPGWWVTAEHV